MSNIVITLSFFSLNTLKKLCSRQMPPLPDLEPGLDYIYLHNYKLIVHFKFILQEQLHKKIKSTINKCDSNLFVFDELQDVPEGILDVLIPILENNDRSIDSRYIFI